MGRARWVTCDSCGRSRPHTGRGLCSACRSRASRNDTLPDWERTTRPWSELVAEAEGLRAAHGEPQYRPGPRGWVDREQTGGVTWQQIADRLGVTLAALDRARVRVGADERDRTAV